MRECPCGCTDPALPLPAHAAQHDAFCRDVASLIGIEPEALRLALTREAPFSPGDPPPGLDVSGRDYWTAVSAHLYVRWFSRSAGMLPRPK
jgi:hypothetical protein